MNTREQGEHVNKLWDSADELKILGENLIEAANELQSKFCTDGDKIDPELFIDKYIQREIDALKEVAAEIGEASADLDFTWKVI